MRELLTTYQLAWDDPPRRHIEHTNTADLRCVSSFTTSTASVADQFRPEILDEDDPEVVGTLQLLNGCFQKQGYPKMDGENNGKPY